MDIEKFEDYFDIFCQFYADRKIEVIWNSNEQGIKALVDLEKEISSIHSEFSKDDFIKTAFDIVQISVQISTGMRSEKDFSNEKINIVRNKFLTKEIIDKININFTSKHKVLESMTYEVLTKRIPDNANQIITLTTLLSLNLRDISKVNDDFALQNINIELSKGEIRSLIEQLNSLLIELEKSSD